MEKFVKIMAIVNVLIVIHMITGCDKAPQRTQVTTSEGGVFDVTTIEGCEYLVFSTSLEHKGNCKNPIHVYARKEEDEEDEVKKNREERRKK